MHGRNLKIIIIFLALLSWGELFSQKIGNTIFSFPSPGEFPLGITMKDGVIFHADKNSNKIFELDSANGELINSFSLPDSCVPGDVTFVEDELWIVDSKNLQILGFDFQDSSYSVKVRLHTIKPAGLTADRNYCWYLDQRTKFIYKINLFTKQYEDSVIAPGVLPTGLCKFRDGFWISDMTTAQLYWYDYPHRSVVQIVPLSSRFPQGIVYSGKSIYLCSLEKKEIQKVALHSKNPYRVLDSLTVHLRYSVSLKNVGSSTMQTKTYIAVPKNLISQTLLDSVVFSEEPLYYFYDKFGQKIAYFYKEIFSGGEKTYSYDVPATIRAIRYFIDPDIVGTLEEIPDSIKNLYTENGDKYQIYNSSIQQAANDAVGSETNLYWQVRKIHDYVIGKIYYNNDSRWDAAPDILQQGHGSCSEYSFLFIALCRAKGIPARYEAGSHIRDEIPYQDTVFHRWQQVYFPRYGWIPMDCTWDDRSDMVNQALYFGAKSSQTFTTTIGGGGATGLWWTYNSANSTSGGDMDRDKKMEWLQAETSIEFAPLSAHNTKAEDYKLIYNYPNPFNSSTNIVFRSGEMERVRVIIYNLNGQNLFETNIFANEGVNTFRWDGIDRYGRQVPSGIYLVDIEFNALKISRLIALIR